MRNKQTLIHTSEDTMITQLKLLLNDGYAVAVIKNVDVFDTTDKKATYTLCYSKKEGVGG